MPYIKDLNFMDATVSDIFEDLDIRDINTYGYITHGLYYRSIKIGFIEDYEHIPCQFFHCTTSGFPNRVFFKDEAFFQAILYKITDYARINHKTSLLLDCRPGYMGALKTNKEWLTYGLNITQSNVIVNIAIDY